MPDFKDIALKIKVTDKPYSMSVRDLMKSVGHYRRGTDANRTIRNHLRRHKLMVEPDFELVNIESRIQIFPLEGKRAFKKPEVHPKSKPIGGAESTSNTEQSDEERAVVLTIGQLPSAVREPIFVTRDEPITRAVTLMLQEDVDHLVVSQNKRVAEGLITWSSIGRARAGRGCGSKMSDCMEREPYVVRFDALLFDTVREITRRGIALVRSVTGTIGGSVTTADVAEQFVTLSEPFLFLDQIENHLRVLLRSAKPSADALQELVDPRDEARKAKVKSVDNLTFGETLRAFENQYTWEKMQLELDRKTVIGGLKKVNEIRNSVMHFHPDGISEEDREILRRTRHMLQIL
jgi:CBS domain-containing protein